MERKRRHAQQQKANREYSLRNNGGTGQVSSSVGPIEVQSDGEVSPLELVEPMSAKSTSNVNLSGVEQRLWERNDSDRRAHLMWEDAFKYGEDNVVTTETCPFCIRTRGLPEGDECLWH